MEIVGYENYLIYEDGRVQNKKTKRYLKSWISDGYYHVELRKDGKRKSYRVHRLIALYYIPNPENKKEVDHINRDRADNRIENLRWATKSENNQNKGCHKNNKLGIKNICLECKSSYKYQKKFRGQKISKRFKTLEEAIQFKNEYESKLN
tara:strand:+ start:1463 stop:1912 length:450 start_codon:yes stop_codon:yes gene_type:complete